MGNFRERYRQKEIFHYWRFVKRCEKNLKIKKPTYKIKSVQLWQYCQEKGIPAPEDVAYEFKDWLQNKFKDYFEKQNPKKSTRMWAIKKFIAGDQDQKVLQLVKEWVEKFDKNMSVEDSSRLKKMFRIYNYINGAKSRKLKKEEAFKKCKKIIGIKEESLKREFYRFHEQIKKHGYFREHLDKWSKLLSK